MQNIIKKAAVLIEAIPYIRKFRNTITVIKLGGSLEDDAHAINEILKDIIFLSSVGIKPVLIHGGGRRISARMAKAGLEPKFFDGLRITDAPVIKIVKKTLYERNLELTRQIKRLGWKAKSLCGKRNEIIWAEKLRPQGKDIGFVGEVSSVNIRPIVKAFNAGEIPVLTPLGFGSDGQTYNINADQAACDIATALKAEKFVLITDIKGILMDKSDDLSIISTLTINKAQSLIKKGIINTGMIPKVKSIITALNGGVKKTHIIDGRLPHAILLEIFTDKGIGTEIIK
ncbi:MAG: acetylglutamate kinase [Planctomycetota bacterium]